MDYRLGEVTAVGSVRRFHCVSCGTLFSRALLWWAMRAHDSPLAGQGVNLGIKTLGLAEQLLKSSGDVGSVAVLRA